VRKEARRLGEHRNARRSWDRPCAGKIDWGRGARPPWLRKKIQRARTGRKEQRRSAPWRGELQTGSKNARARHQGLTAGAASGRDRAEGREIRAGAWPGRDGEDAGRRRAQQGEDEQRDARQRAGARNAGGNRGGGAPRTSAGRRENDEPETMEQRARAEGDSVRKNCEQGQAWLGWSAHGRRYRWLGGRADEGENSGGRRDNDGAQGMKLARDKGAANVEEKSPEQRAAVEEKSRRRLQQRINTKHK
jgi:hypothetical protein